MRSRWMLVLLPALILLFAACGDDDDGPTGGDATAPSAVTDLAAIAAGDSSITLTWTTPDDPSKTSSVSRYDLRYSLSAITDANWDAADTLAGEPVPGAPGVAETLAVAGLDLGTTDHFALRS